MDIVFGDCVTLGGHRYALLLASALKQFKSDAGRLPHRFHFNFYRKLISGNALRWILLNGSYIISAPAGRQYLNG